MQRRGFLGSLLGLFAVRHLPDMPIPAEPVKSIARFTPVTQEVVIHFSGPATFDPGVQRIIVEAQRKAIGRMLPSFRIKPAA